MTSRLQISNLLLGFVLKLLQLVVVALIIVPVSILVWQAATTNEIVFDPIRTPPDLSGHGIDGVVAASRLLDKLNKLVRDADVYASRTATRTRGGWDENAAVEIPGTGVSIEELVRILRDWFGNEIRVSGELYARTNSRIALTVRLNGQVLPELVDSGPAKNRTGADAGSANMDTVDKLLDNAARAILKVTDPYRYAISLGVGDCNFPPNDLKVAPHCEFLEQVAADHSYDANTRAWMYTKLSERLMSGGFWRQGVAASQKAQELMASNPMPNMAIAAGYEALGQPEKALQNYQLADRKLSGLLPSDFSHTSAVVARLGEEAGRAELTGAFGDAALYKIQVSRFDNRNLREFEPASTATNYARAYDVGAELHWLQLSVASRYHWPKSDGASTEQFQTIQYALPTFFALVATDNWQKAVQDLSVADQFAGTEMKNVNDVRHTFIWPWLAYAYAKKGEATTAAKLIAMTPLDCYWCVVFRGRIQAVAGNWNAAGRWFAEASRQGPSIPFADLYWGEMLVQKGDFDGAIAHYEHARAQGPHFADPLEKWGEALITKRRSDLALAKFGAADKYAPNWGRLHLKWGEALLYAGRKVDARKQFAIAFGLCLSAADRIELARMTGATT